MRVPLPYGSHLFIYEFLFCFGLSLTRAICVTMGWMMGAPVGMQLDTVPPCLEPLIANSSTASP